MLSFAVILLARHQDQANLSGLLGGVRSASQHGIDRGREPGLGPRTVVIPGHRRWRQRLIGPGASARMGYVNGPSHEHDKSHPAAEQPFHTRIASEIWPHTTMIGRLMQVKSKMLPISGRTLLDCHGLHFATL